jgi:hypothetical protein
VPFLLFTAHDLKLLYQIEVHCEKGIRACVYADAVGGSDSNMWAFTQNCFSEAAIKHWCCVFGTDNEPTHFKQFFAKERPKSLFTLECVRERLRQTARMSEDGYTEFQKNVMLGRNKYFIHNEFTEQQRGKFPDLDVFKRIALEMRDIICELISQEEADDKDFLENFRKLVEWNRNPRYLLDIEKDSKHFRALMLNDNERK